MIANILLASLKDAYERCQVAFAAVEAVKKAVEQGIMDSDLALISAMENLKRACDHFDLVNNNARRYINNPIKIGELVQSGRLRPRRQPTVAEPAPVTPVLADVRSVAVHSTAAENVPVRPVVADASEEHNTATPQETVDYTTAAPQETIEHKTAAPKETVEHNWDLPDFDPNKKV